MRAGLTAFLGPYRDGSTAVHDPGTLGLESARPTSY
jgi:hypothetical protein